MERVNGGDKIRERRRDKGRAIIYILKG